MFDIQMHVLIPSQLLHEREDLASFRCQTHSGVNQAARIDGVFNRRRLVKIERRFVGIFPCAVGVFGVCHTILPNHSVVVDFPDYFRHTFHLALHAGGKNPKSGGC